MVIIYAANDGVILLILQLTVTKTQPQSLLNRSLRPFIIIRFSLLCYSDILPASLLNVPRKLTSKFYRLS